MATNQLTEIKSKSMHTWVTRRLRLVAFVVFAALGALAAFAWYNSSQTSLRQDQMIGLTELEIQLTAQLQDALDETRTIATSRTAQEFAESTRSSLATELDREFVAAVQQNFVSDLTDAMRLNADRFINIRYLAGSGRTRLQIINNGNMTTVDINGTEQIVPEVEGNPAYELSRSAAPGEVVLSALTFENDPRSDSEERTPVWRLYAPVTGSNATNEVLGVLEIDLLAEPILNLIGAEPGNLIAERNGRRILLASNQLLLLSDSAATNTTFLQGGSMDAGARLSNFDPALFELLRANDTNVAGASFANNQMATIRTFNVTEADNVSLQLIALDDLTGIRNQSIAIFAIMTLFGLSLTLIMQRTINQAFTPLRVASIAAQQVADGQLDIPLPALEHDREAAQLLQAIARMKDQLRNMSGGLEPAQAQRQSRAVEIAGRINQEITTTTSLEQLAERAITLICAQLNLHHAQLFVVDDAGLNARLFYSHGEIGKRLMQKEVIIAIASNTIIGAVVRDGEAHVLSDSEETWFDPLPTTHHQTQSQIALPLRSKQRVIAVLDVQDTEVDSLDETMIAPMQLIANQIAVGFYNMQLREEARMSIQQANELSRRLTREVWQQTSEQLGTEISYHYDLFDVRTDVANGDSNSDDAISMPISIRGQVIGTLSAANPEGYELTEGDQIVLRAVAERVGMAIENARLLRETQIEANRALALAEASQFANRIGSQFEENINIVFKRVATVAGFDRWRLLIYEAESNQLVKLAWERAGHLPQFDDTQRVAISLDADVSVTKAFREDRIVIVNDPYVHPSTQNLDEESILALGKHIVAPVRIEHEVVGVLMIGRSIDAADIVDADEQLVVTLSAQVGIALENRRLLQTAESERQNLRSILATMPAGVLVLNAETLKPVQFNAQAEALLGRPIEMDTAFSIAFFNLQRTGTETLYPQDALPVYKVLETGKASSADDISIPHPDGGQTDLLMSAAPITDQDGNIINIVVAFDNISNLRSLENALQDNLRETTALYQATRSLAEADDLDSILTSIITQVATLEPSNVYVALRQGDDVVIARSLYEENMLSAVPQELLIESDFLVISDIRQREEMDAASREVLTAAGVQTVISLPLTIRQKAAGWIIITYQHPHRLQPQEERFLVTLSDNAAIAVDNWNLLQSTQAALQEAESLYNATTTINAASEISELGHILQRALENLRPDVLAIYLTPQEEDAGYTSVFESEDASVYRFNEIIERHHVLQYDTVFIEDIAADDEPADVCKALRTHTDLGAVAFVNMMVKGVSNGVIVLGYHKPRLFGETDKRYLRTVGDSASVVIDNNLLFDQIQSALEETSTLYQASRSLADSSTPADILNTVVDHLIQPHITSVFIAVLQGKGWDDPRASIVIEKSWQKSEDDVIDLTGISMTAGQFPVWDLLATDVAITIDDIETQHDLTDEQRTAIMTLGARSLAIIPLFAAGQPMGVVWVGSPEPHRHSSAIQRMYQAFAEQASLSIGTVRLLEQTQRRARQMATSAEVSRSASSLLPLEELLPQVVDVIKNAFEYDHVQIFLMDDNDEHAVLVASTGEAGKKLLAINHSLLKGSMSVVGQTSVRGEPVLALDTTDTGVVHRPNAYLPLTRSEAGFPIFIQDRVIGVLDVQSNYPNAFSDSDIAALNTLANQIGVAINNARLFAQAERQASDMSALYTVSRALANSQSPEDILNAVTENLIEEHVETVLVAVLYGESWEDPNAFVNIEATWRRRQIEGVLDLQGINLTAAQFPAWEQLGNPSVLIINDALEDETLSETQRMALESLDARSLVIIPLRIAGRSIGSIWIGSPHPYEYSERHQRLYESFAEQASLSLEAARLLEQTEHRARQLATTAEVSRTTSAILSLDELLPRLVNIIKDAFSYDHVQIFLMDNTHENAVLRASTGEAGQELLAVHHSLQRGSASIIGQATALGEPVVALDTTDADVVHRPNPYLPLTRSELALPLKIKQDVIGALDVQSNRPNAFGEDDIAALTSLAGQIAIAINNAQLFQRSESRAADMSFLFTVTTAAASAPDLPSALQQVSELMWTSLEASMVVFYLPETYVNEHNEPFTILRPVAYDGIEMPLSEITDIFLDDDSIVAETARSLNSAMLDNVHESEAYSPIHPEARSAILAPLSSGGDLVGMVILEFTSESSNKPDVTTLLLTLSGTLAAIIQNAQLLEQMQRTNEQLRELDRMKSDFLANMSHELRTPLNSIIGFSRVMLKGIDGPLTEMQEQDLKTIFDSGQHLLGLINDILDQAKISSMKMEDSLKFEYFDMKNVIEGVRSMGIGLVKDKPIDIFIEVASGLPQVYGDEFRIRQVLLNLVSNATKFTNEGSITIQVYTETDEETGHLMVRTDVADTGIGIAEKDLPLLFEAFRQVDSSLTRTVGGTGLGLPIAKSLVEMHGGKMLVTSEVNVGSTFSILLPTEPIVDATSGENAPDKLDTDELEPVTISDDVEPNDTEPTRNGSTREPVETMETPSTKVPKRKTNSIPRLNFPSRKREILLIEEDPTMVDQFRRVLQREGFEVQTGDNPMMAKAMASGMHPTVIILDVNLADGEGWDILQYLKERADTADIPVVVVTLNEDKERALEMGAYAYVQRPFLPDELTKIVLAAETESNKDRILIIDDQPESARLLKQILDAQERYRVFTAQSGKDGVSMIALRRPNLILLDLRMPQMDGFAVLDELRANPETANIPVIVVTGEEVDAKEREYLDGIDLIHKIEISETDYDKFIQGIRNHLQFNGE